MDIRPLVEAATLAESLSTFRHKKVRLVLTAGGIKAEGKLIRPDGVVILDCDAEQPWDRVEAEPGALEAMIRKVDRSLVAEWTSIEPEDDH